jgi:two-component system, NtrC family, sensor kinase
MNIAILLFLIFQVNKQDTQKPDFSFLQNLSTKRKIDKILDTCNVLNKEEPDIALQLLEKGSELIKLSPDSGQEKQIILQKASSFMQLSEYKKSDEYLETSFNFHKELNDDEYLIKYYNIKASNYYYQSNLSKAVEYFNASLRIAEKINDTRWLGTILNNIGNIYMYCGMNDDAMKHYKKSIEYSERCKNYHQLAVVNDNIGQLYNGMGNYNESLKYLWEANRLYKELNNQIYYAWNFTYLADTYNKLGNKVEAERCYKTSLEKSRKYNHVFAIVEASVGLGKLYFVQNKYDEAFKTLKDIEPLALESKNFSFLTELYKTISDIYKYKNDYKNSYYYFVKYNENSDSLSAYDLQQKVRELDLKYNMEKKDNELSILKKDNQLSELNLAKARGTRNYLVALFTLIVFSLGIILLIKTRSVKKLEEQQEVINTQKNELETANKNLIDSQLELQDLNRNLEIKVAEEVKKREAQQLMVMQKSKLESLGILSAGIAHEINQPLTSISFSLENLVYKNQTGTITDDYLQNKFSSIETDINRITQIINHIRVFAREQGEIKFDRFNLNDVINNSQLMVNAQLRNKSINVNLSLSNIPLLVTGNRYRLEQVLLNLILNAKYAVEKKETTSDNFDFQKKITISTFFENSFACFSVEDNGIGIPNDVKEKVFEPFFTTKEADAGTGLGLSIAYGIINEHKGEIVIDSKPNEYTKFTIKIPSLTQDNL